MRILNRYAIANLALIGMFFIIYPMTKNKIQDLYFEELLIIGIVNTTAFKDWRLAQSLLTCNKNFLFLF